MNVVRETVKCPRCGQVQVGLRVVDGKLMTDQIQLLGFICQCGRVVHWGKRNDKKMVTITNKYPFWQMPENILPLDLDETAGRIGAIAYADALTSTDWSQSLRIRKLVDDRATLAISLKERTLTWGNMGIWWTSAEDIKQVQKQHLLYDRVWPGYIRTAFAYRCMTVERGLLYHAPEMILETKTTRDYVHNREMAVRVMSCGGVVVCREELAFVLSLPGFVTDDKLQELRLE